ncbi:MAG: hypothetical protein ACI865_003141 [Flavobacteriaceae bacterium]|jgi:hypothetical protein
MKRKIISFLAGVTLSLSSSAQVVSISIGGSGDISGTQYDITASSAEVHLTARVTNLTPDSMDLQITRDRIVSFPSWEDHFCWGVVGDPFGACYSFEVANPWSSPVSDTVRLQQSDKADLEIYIKPLDPDYGCGIYRYIVRQGATVLDSIDIGICKTADLEYLIDDSNLSVFPNPANSSITVNFENALKSNVSFELRDMFGRVVISKPFHAELNTIDVSTLKGGVYFILLRTSNGEIYREKVLIDHN